MGPDRDEDNRRLSKAAIDKIESMSPYHFTLEACTDDKGTNSVTSRPLFNEVVGV